MMTMKKMESDMMSDNRADRSLLRRVPSPLGLVPVHPIEDHVVDVDLLRGPRDRARPRPGDGVDQYPSQ